MDRKTKTVTVMTVNKELDLGSDNARIYLSREKGGKGLISCKACFRGEANNRSSSM